MAGRTPRQVAGRLAALVLSASIAPASNAFEAFDGRLQLHGFYESTIRSLNADYGEDWDVAQWYQILNLELELDLIQETVGPVDLLSVFVRAEVRYDCIYSRGCGMFRSMNAYGDRSKSLPRRLNNAVRVTHAGRIRVANEPGLPERYSGSNTDPLNNSNQPILSLVYDSPGADGVAPSESCDLGPVCPFLAGGDGRTVATLSPELGGPPLDTGMRVPLAPRVIQSLWPRNDDPFPELERAGSFGDFR